MGEKRNSGKLNTFMSILNNNWVICYGIAQIQYVHRSQFHIKLKIRDTLMTIDINNHTHLIERVQVSSFLY